MEMSASQILIPFVYYFSLKDNTSFLYYVDIFYTFLFLALFELSLYTSINRLNYIKTLEISIIK